MRPHRRSRRQTSHGLKWALSTVAPWALAGGMLVSFTASAGQNTGKEPLSAASLAYRTEAVPSSELEEGPSLLSSASAFRLPGLSLRSAVQKAHLSFEKPERRMAVDPLAPRDELKREAARFPEIDRTAKSDPLLVLRPGISAGKARALEEMVFGDTQPKLVSAGFVPDAGRESEISEGPALGFEPYAADEGLTDRALSDKSPHSVRPVITSPRQAELHLESIDGSSPSVPTAAARSSTTPATPGQAPTTRAPTLLARGSGAAVTDIRKIAPGVRLSYLDLISDAEMARQQKCLAEAVYFEARSESEEGRAAVAQVVLNRARSGLYPSTVCGVVYQNSNRYLSCQFTFTCEGKSLRITEPESWKSAVRIARDVYEGKIFMAEVGASTHYHADYVRPHWARKLKKMDTIGRHTFYQLRPGQS